MTGLDRSIAVLHEHYPARGGGEMVADELARTFGGDVFTGFAEDGMTPDDVDVHDLFGDSLLGPLIRRSFHVRDLFYQFGWTHLPEVADADVLVTSGCNPMWAVPRDDQTVVSYVHSPPRVPFDLWARDESPRSPLQHLYGKAARVLHPRGRYADRLIANSDLVARRMVQYWGVDESDIDVVYPPIETHRYSPSEAETDDYYLVWSRLWPAKRIDDIVRACTREGVRLIVGGDGPDRDRLEQMAGETVEFRGFVPDDELPRLVSGAKAVIFNAQNEDFGMVPIEAMAAGTPVIGVRDGFTRHQIFDGMNGLLFDSGERNLRKAIRRFERAGVEADEDEIAAFADQFSVERFRREMRRIVSEATEAAAIRPNLEEPWAPVPRERVLADGGES